MSGASPRRGVAREAILVEMAGLRKIQALPIERGAAEPGERVQPRDPGEAAGSQAHRLPRTTCTPSSTGSPCTKARQRSEAATPDCCRWRGGTKKGTDQVPIIYDLIGAPGEIRTPDLLVRSQTLYPTELRARDFLSLGGAAPVKPGPVLPGRRGIIGNLVTIGSVSGWIEGLG